MLPSFNRLTEAELEQLERLAVAADIQIQEGRKDWPGRPCRQRLDLFLATNPQVVMALVAMARDALRAEMM